MLMIRWKSADATVDIENTEQAETTELAVRTRRAQYAEQ